MNILEFKIIPTNLIILEMISKVTNVTIWDLWLGIMKFQIGTTIIGKTLEPNLQDHEIDTKHNLL